MSLLEARAVCKSYGKLRSLDVVDFVVEEREFHGLIGPNGSGKSTLMKCLAGAEAPTSGAIEFDGRDVVGLGPAERALAGMSIKFQITSVLPTLSVFDNMLLAIQAREPLIGLVRSRTRKKVFSQIMDTLVEFRLIDRVDAPAGTLSHGQQQWLEIAMALSLKPKLLLLDEPTAGMSLEERRATGELLRPIKSRCSLIVVEHDLDFVRGFCDRLTVLDQGRVVDSGSVEQIQSSAKVQGVYLTRM